MSCTERIEGAVGVCYAVRLSPNEHPERPRIRLGKVTKKQADTARSHVEELVACRRTGTVMPPATQQWVTTLDQKTRIALSQIGLLGAMSPGGANIKVGEWVTEFIRKRTDIKPRTRENMTQVRMQLVEFLSEDIPLAAFTPGHAADFRLFLLGKGQAEATIRLGCKRAKQFFAAAIKHEHIKSNPFDDVPTGNVANSERLVVIPSETIEQVIKYYDYRVE